MVKIFITVDTEVWPRSPGWPHTPLAEDKFCEREIAAYLYGEGLGGESLGVPYQLRTLANAGLKATFFVEPLFSFALGIAPLRELAAAVTSHGQEVGLHLHPEWLTDRRCRGLPQFAGPLLHGYREPDQAALVSAGIDRLREAGAPPIRAFRAGSWGASRATLRALAQNGIGFDSSLNAGFVSSFPDLDAESRAGYTQPVLIEGVWEFPVTSFVDRPPAGLRPLHVCAASFGEFRGVLDHAHANGWYAVVIVLHSFEFVRVDALERGGSAPQRLLADRFERLCAHLADNAERFESCHFADIDRSVVPRAGHPAVSVSSRSRTAIRQIQQLASRFY